MRDRRRQLAGFSVAALLALAALPGGGAATPGLASAAPSLASPLQRPFIAPRPRPGAISARPTDDPDPNLNTYLVKQAPKSPACAPHFCVHWVARGIDAPDQAGSRGDGVPEYVETVLEVAEYVRSVENGQLGWQEPKSDGKAGGAKGKTDIYLAQIRGDLFGYAAPDSGQASAKHPVPRRLHGYLVLDNDYSALEFPGTYPVNDLKLTLAHEYNHLLQFGYDAFQDPWMAESTATWMENQVFGRLNGYIHYVEYWAENLETPLTASSFKEYGSAVWNEWLTQRYGADAVRDAWARALRTKPGGLSTAVYDAAIRAAGPSGLGHDFTEFAAAVAEWRTGLGFPESRLYADARRQGQLDLNGRSSVRRLKHTTFQLLRIRARGGRAVVVHAKAPQGVALGLALVGRVGGAEAGQTVSVVRFRRRGGSLTVRLPEPGRFSRITAVLVNADTRVDGFSSRRLDWNYLGDRSLFAISGQIARAPNVPETPASR